MAENINFISAADLPTTESEEVDVLCVENGELKRKAVNSYDAVIHMIEEGNDTDGYTGTTLTLEKGSRDTLIELLANGVMPKVLIYGNMYYGGNYYLSAESTQINMSKDDASEPLTVNFVYAYGYTNYVFIHPDDIVSTNWEL